MSSPPTLLFDGDCAMCNRAVHFVLERERSPELLFASLQSPYGRSRLARAGLDENYDKSLVLEVGGQVLLNSDAALVLASYLKAPWSWLSRLRLCPTFLRDGVYRLVARNRHRLFSDDQCLLLPAHTRDRFIEDAPP